MRISDWSSDVCSSDLQYLALFDRGDGHLGPQVHQHLARAEQLGLLETVGRDDQHARAGDFHDASPLYPYGALRIDARPVPPAVSPVHRPLPCWRILAGQPRPSVVIGPRRVWSLRSPRPGAKLPPPSMRSYLRPPATELVIGGYRVGERM